MKREGLFAWFCKIVFLTVKVFARGDTAAADANYWPQCSVSLYHCFNSFFPLDLFGLCVCFFPSEGHRMLSREFVFCLFIIDVAKCNLCKVKLQANLVFGLLLKRMWSVEWLQGPLLFLWLTLHLMLAFWADLCGSVVEANLSGFWLPALLSLFGGSVQVYDVSNYYIFSPLS